MNVETELFNKEQEEIVRKVLALSKTSRETGIGGKFSWNRYNGRVACNVVKYYLEKHLRSGLKAATSVFIKGLPIEFDILIIDKDAVPEEFTDAFDPESVHSVIEVKSHGTIGEERLEQIKRIFEKLDKEYGIKPIYLTIREAGKPQRKGSKNWIEITTKILSPYKVYVLSDSRKGELYPDQWKNFIEYINSL
ncbi:MAG: hypothetical protein LM601_08775 [Candidatus Verstraetearchaeota archaeon]|jgi:hypothetical protein|nr:hypothetical protein [Candidatus Verstraetearchaeota archaeon]